ncbi:MAG: glycosyltransferase family 9 protein [Proteobacteria bacterium]|nr:glycosyltransferase family 9 protein [Pseudomonadota bacterium]
MPKRLLFVTSTRIGDAVLSTGLLDTMIRRHPGLRVTVACGPAAASLFEGVPGLEQIIRLDKMVGSLHWIYFWSKTAGVFWDIMIDLRNSPITYLIMARQRYRLLRARAAGHRINALAKVIGLDGDPPAPRLWLDDTRKREAARLIPEGRPVLAVGPTANWSAKQWRGQHFAELIRRLTAANGILPGAMVAVFGRDDERPMSLQLLDSVPSSRLIDLVGRIDLLTAYGCLARSALYIGNDSGLMHLAAASGTPTLGLFGPSPVEQYAPWGPHCGTVQASVSYEEIFPEDFDHRNTDTLMDSLSVDAAEAAAGELWARTREKVS